MKKKSYCRPDKLRVRAEKSLGKRYAVPEEMSEMEAKELIHELQVHQIELEMQNEELRKTHAELEESRTKYADLYDFAPVGYLTLDRKGRVIEMNLTAAGMLGVERGLIMNHSFQRFIVSKSKGAFVRHLTNCTDVGGKVSFEAGIKDRRGKEFFALLDAVLWEDSDGKASFRVSLTDITAQKVAEETLRKAQEEKLHAILDHSPAVIYVKNLDGRYIFINRHCESLIGVSQDDIKGRTDHDTFPKEIADNLRANDLRVIRAKGPIEFEEVALHEDGPHTYISVKFPLCGLSGEIESICGISTDISNRKKAEVALRESEERYRDLYECAPCAYVSISAKDGSILHNNSEMCKLFGYDNTELTGLKIFDLYADTSRGLPRAKQIFESLKKGETVSNYEVEMKKRNGDIFWCRVSTHPLLDNHGQVMESRSIIVDINKSKLVEEALRESEERFKQLAENISEVFWMTDPRKNHMIYISSGYEKIWGRSCDSLYESPRDWLTAVHPDDRARVLNSALTKQVSGEYNEEYRIIRPDGSIRWIRDRAYPIRDETGEIYRILGIAIDFTDHKEVEEALKKSEQRFKDISENALEWIWETDDKGKYTYASPLVKDMLGYEPHEVVGKYFYHFSRVDERNRLKKYVDEKFTTKASFKDITIKKIHKNAATVYCETSGVPIIDNKGKLLGYRGSARDITKRRLMEDALSKKTNDLNLLNKQLENLTMEITKIGEKERRRYAETLHEGAGQNLVAIQIIIENVAKQLSLGGTIEKETITTLISLINDTIKMTQNMTTDIYPFVLEHMDAEAALRWYIRKVLGKNKIKVFLSIDGTVDRLQHDFKHHMFRIVRELLLNIKDHAKASKIEVKVKEYRGSLRLIMKDNGVGFEHENIQNLSECGIGLMLVKAWANSLGGCFNVESQPGEGTNITVDLPITYLAS